MTKPIPTAAHKIKLPTTTRKIAPDYSGLIVVSDIDKTYLATQIDSLGGLLRAAFETAEAKDNIPGFSILLRALRRGGGVEAAQNPIFFVSASPPQLRQTLMAKMQLDGVEHNGIIFKNQLEHVRSGAFKKLREQIGYKLSALLRLWLDLPPASRILLFGDDSESDPIIYSLFCDVLGNVARGPALYDLLSYLGVFHEESQLVADLSECVEGVHQTVDGVFINLVTGSQPNYYSRFGPQFYPTDNSMQAALALFEKGLIRERAVRSLGRELVLHYDFSPAKILESLRLASLRGLFGMDTLHKLWPLLHESHVLPAPESREDEEGALTRLNIKRWTDEGPSSLNQLKAKYSDDGRY